ncbi:hypothetical protein B0H15DRAFT_815709 [Mycena belliarum]|uniref:Secreted protein n=1 Tax=Mycena belliarum TaxID=1033014 RepID=A0AAD6UIE4_9AGAR|nr:hypothetical protein B0H15DRAFT_815709 [Mycena belliae]
MTRRRPLWPNSLLLHVALASTESKSSDTTRNTRVHRRRPIRPDHHDARSPPHCPSRNCGAPSRRSPTERDTPRYRIRTRWLHPRRPAPRTCMRDSAHRRKRRAQPPRTATEPPVVRDYRRLTSVRPCPCPWAQATAARATTRPAHSRAACAAPLANPRVGVRTHPFLYGRKWP